VKEAIEHVKKHTAPPVRKKPFTRKLLQTLLDKVDEENFLELRDTFMFTLCRKGTMRASEVVDLEDTDAWEEKVEVNGEFVWVLFMIVEKMKNDQYRKGHTIVLQAEPAAPEMCVVRQFRRYREARAKELAKAIRRDPSRVKNATHLFPKQGFRGAKIAPSTFNTNFKSRCKAAGIPAVFTSHCLRVGGVTAAIAAGIELRLVARHGNWKSEAIFRYISDDLEQKRTVANAIGFFACTLVYGT